MIYKQLPAILDDERKFLLSFILVAEPVEFVLGHIAEDDMFVAGLDRGNVLLTTVPVV